MKKALSLFALVFLTALPAAAADVEAPKGFTPLFNGKDLNGWHGWAIHSKGAGPYDLAKLSDDERSKQIEAWTADSKKHWKAENNELVNDGTGAYLATDKDYGDFELLIDYKTVAKADSGIYLRASPQVQIWDYTEAGGKWKLGADKGSGGLWNNSAGAPGKDPLVLADKPFGEWNSFRIIMVGERVSIWLNGKHIVDHARLENLWDRKKPLLKKAPIVLQTHGGEIRWRNIFIREIAGDEANDILRKHGSTGFKDIFNGKDFDGWAGPTANYEVKEGTIACKPKSGGTIFTKEEFEDFVARVDIRIPHGGNNGLAIRYPGKGDPAYAGMCELQVLDDDYETARKAKIDPRQAHGSAYGMAAAARGYQRPIGEWNFQEVTVKGSTIKVELNGFLILDTDLSKITEYMAKSPHPGKENTKGAFGFAGHGDAVAFKHVQIKRISKVD